MNYYKVLIVLILMSLAVAFPGCTGSQTVPNSPSESQASPDVGFARSNPAPIGTSVAHEFEISERNSDTGMFSYTKAEEKIMVLDVKRGYDRVESALSADGARSLDEYTQDANYRGFEPLLVKIRYELVSVGGDLSQPWQSTDYNVDLIATDGNTYANSMGGQPFHIFTSDYGVPELWYESYGIGSMDGYALMFVDGTDKNPLIRFTAGGSSTYLWFKTTA